MTNQARRLREVGILLAGAAAAAVDLLMALALRGDLIQDPSAEEPEDLARIPTDRAMEAAEAAEEAVSGARSLSIAI